MSNKAIQYLFLMIEELFTNSIKHAFGQQENPQINITLAKMGDNTIQLSYYDNGSGLKENYDFHQRNESEFEILLDLIHKLKGKWKAYNTQGLSFKFDFDHQTLIAL